MLRVGLTGGMGTGKSTIARIFSVLGIPVYYADDAAKHLMNTNEDLKSAIKEIFGEAAYQDNKLDRSFIAHAAFKNAELLSRLNNIVHPATIAHAAKWLQQQVSPYAIKEAALIFEAGAEKELDVVIGVQSPLPLRIKRLMQRDHTTETEILSRMQKQMDEDEKMKRCDYVIINDEKHLVIPQVIALHEKLLLRAAS